MGIFDDAVPGGNIATPIMVALGALLLGKMFGGGSSSPVPQTAPSPMPQAGGGGLGGLLSGLGGAAGAGGLAGGLGGLLEKLTQAGHGDVANSWVGPGANQPIQPNQLGTALGHTTVSDLAKQAGISEEELLAQLSRVLPGVVDKMTPGGRIPGLAEIAGHFNT